MGKEKGGGTRDAVRTVRIPELFARSTPKGGDDDDGNDIRWVASTIVERKTGPLLTVLSTIYIFLYV